MPTDTSPEASTARPVHPLGAVQLNLVNRLVHASVAESRSRTRAASLLHKAEQNDQADFPIAAQACREAAAVLEAVADGYAAQAAGLLAELSGSGS